MLQNIIEQLKTRNLMRVSLETGISLVTLQNLVAGRNTNPQWRTIEALYKFLKEQSHEHASESKKA
jgi:DNA-binding transcriptional MerR regulator